MAPLREHHIQLSLKEAKQTIVQNDFEVKGLIKDLWDEKETPDRDTLNDINVRLAKAIRAHKQSIVELEKLIFEFSKTKTSSPICDTNSLNSELDGFRNQLEINLAQLKKANLSAQKRIEEIERKALLSGNQPTEIDGDASSTLRRRSQIGMGKHNTAKKASVMTDTLLAVSQLMASQVSRSEATLQSLANQSNTVVTTQEEFKSMGALIGQSKTLLTKFGRREVTDKVLIFLAIAFFFACCFYVVTKRLF